MADRIAHIYSINDIELETLKVPYSTWQLLIWGEINIYKTGALGQDINCLALSGFGHTESEGDFLWWICIVNY